jgi:sugar phosphate isomerase/epimerase
VKPNEIGIMLAVGEDPVANIEKVKSLGVSLVQMGSPDDVWLVDPKRAELKKMLDNAGIEVFTVFVGFEGEAYDDIETVKRTVGYLNAEARASRLERTLRVCDFAKVLGAPYLGSHVGFIPEDPDDPQYAEMVSVVQQITDYCAGLDLKVAMETGQEPAKVLLRFMGNVGRDNLFVNFDPANMILYGSGDPHEALALLKDKVVSVHVKDGKWPTAEGQLGQMTPLGEGEVDIPRFIEGLKAFGFAGPLVIEREITGPEQVAELREGIQMLKDLW